MDPFKFRETMTNLLFHGKEPERTPEQRLEEERQRAREARESMGKGGNLSKLEELRAMNKELADRASAGN